MHLFIIGIGGSFNPIHREHVSALRVAREELESRFGEGCVLSAHVAVAPDGYVRGKLKEQAIRGTHRVAMVERAAQCLLDNIYCNLKGYNFSVNVAICASAEQMLDTAMDTLYCHLDHLSITKVIVAGADRAKPKKRKQFHARIMIARSGSSSSLAEDLRSLVAASPLSPPADTDTCLSQTDTVTTQTSNTHDVTSTTEVEDVSEAGVHPDDRAARLWRSLRIIHVKEELPAVSSTLIRERLQQRQGCDRMLLKWLHEEVLEYLLEHRGDDDWHVPENRKR